tara:strand:- start:199 stop:417 length:219 start_codon:yes stop_codon:yes gene_type:complete
MKITKNQLKELIKEELTQVNEEGILDENMLKTVMDVAGPLVKDHGLDAIKRLIKMVQENPEIVQKIVSMFAK